MIISRTPYRLSFFGGSTDYPTWYKENPGAVLATSIDKYCYIFCRWLPPFFEHKHRIVYSQTELPNDIQEIRHPAVRETLRFLDIADGGIEIYHAGDLPARTGMGTSSAFTVGLLNALYTLRESRMNKLALALEAIFIEQNLIRENVGSQDQTTAAFGGFNKIDFAINKDSPKLHDIKVTPIKSKRIKELEKCLMLFFTGFSRTADKIAKEQIDRVNDNKPALNEMYSMVGQGVDILTSNSNLNDFGKLLGESWKLKKSLSPNVSTEYIDYLYANAISAGVIGGKLCGAGGGGFLLLFVEPDKQAKVKERLSSLLRVPFCFENKGSHILFNEGGKNEANKVR